MNWIIVSIVALIIIAAWTSMKHRFNFRLKRTLIILAIFFIALAVVSGYIDFSGFFGEDNFFSRTGAAVFFDLKDVLEREDIITEDTLDSIKEDVLKGTDNALDKFNDVSEDLYITRKAN